MEMVRSHEENKGLNPGPLGGVVEAIRALVRPALVSPSPGIPAFHSQKLLQLWVKGFPQIASVSFSGFQECQMSLGIYVSLGQSLSNDYCL